MKPVLAYRRLLMLFLLSSTLAASAQLKKIVYSPQWHAHAQFAGYIVARQLGYYEQEGLDVEIKYPTVTKSSLALMSEGKADLVTTALATALMLKANEGMDIVNVLQTSQHSSTCLLLKTPRKNLNVQSFKALRVGLWYNRLAVPAEAMNISHKLNWQIISFREGFNLMNYDMLDAISVMEYNELLRVKYNGRDVSEHSVLRLCDHGYDIPEDGVYCLSEFYQQHPEEVKAFVRATKKGWDWCRENPEKATELVVSEMRKVHIYSSLVIQDEGLKVVLKKQETTPGKVTYSLQRRQYDNTTRILKSAGLIESVPDFKTFVAP